MATSKQIYPRINMGEINNISLGCFHSAILYFHFMIHKHHVLLDAAMNFIDGAPCVHVREEVWWSRAPPSQLKQISASYIVLFSCLFLLETRNNCNRTIWKCGDSWCSYCNTHLLIVKCKHFLKVEPDKKNAVDLILTRVATYAYTLSSFSHSI